MLLNLLFNIIIVTHVNGVPLSKGKIFERKPDQNPNLFEGDIILTPSLFKSTDRGVLRRGTSVAWPNGIVPYEFLPGYGASQQAFIINVMEKMERIISINNVACVQCRPRNPSDLFYIRFFNGVGCSSPIGYMADENINHTVSLNYPRCFDDGYIMHELLHTLGFYHENSRPDRDNFVKINFENIAPNNRYKFDKYDNSLVDTQNTPYDYASIMHFDPYAFSINDLPTIEALQPDVEFGQRINMSTIDIQEVQLAYNCSSTGTTFPSMPTTTTANLYAVNVTISSSLSNNSENLTDPYDEDTIFYYEEFEVTVPVDGDYILESNSSMDTIGLLYTDNFYPDSLPLNLFAYDLGSGENGQFQINIYLNSNKRYVLVVTTFSLSDTGDYTLLIFGLNRVNLTKINSSSIIPTTTVTPEPSVEPVISSYSSALTVNSPTYDRFGGFGKYYYEEIMIAVPETGDYAVGTNSTIDTYGYLYLNSFNPLNMAENLITGDDDKAGESQFRIVHLFQSGKIYILVLTTHEQEVIGPITILAEGRKHITFTSMNSTTTTTTIQSTSTITLRGCE